VSTSIRKQKASVRTQVRRAILDMRDDVRARKDKAIYRRVLTWLPFRDAAVVLLYVGHFPEEIATGYLLDAALDAGKHVLLPRVDAAGRRMTLHRIVDVRADLEPGVYGIPEPSASCPEVRIEAVDTILVPGLAFDIDGYRVGRGGGYYDRLLGACRPDVVTVSIAYDNQVVAPVPREPHDRPVAHVLTELRTIDTGAA